MSLRPFLIVVACLASIDMDDETAGQTISVSIVKDQFEPTRFQMSTNIPFQSRLTKTRPKEITKEPSYNGTPQWYGWLDLGSQENKRHYFCFDQQDNGQLLLYFDHNNNGDLTDD